MEEKVLKWALFGSALMAISAAAAAAEPVTGWDVLKFGMTRAEVSGAFGNKATPQGAGNLSITTRVGDAPFKAIAVFDGDSLSWVSLLADDVKTLKKDECEGRGLSIASALEGRYGELNKISELSPPGRSSIKWSSKISQPGSVSVEALFEDFGIYTKCSIQVDYADKRRPSNRSF